MAYSLDLRERVIAYIEQGGKKVNASVLFKVSRPTIDGWIRLKIKTGSVKKPPIAPRSWRKINPEVLISLINEQPDSILDDYAKQFNVTNSGIWRSLDRNNFTRKKRPRFIKKEVKKNETTITK